MTSSIFKNKYPKLLGSSIDPYKLSMTIKGLIIGAIPVLVLLGRLTGVDLDPGTLNDLADSAENTILIIGTAVSSVVTLVGVIRKIAVALKIIKPQ